MSGLLRKFYVSHRNFAMRNEKLPKREITLMLNNRKGKETLCNHVCILQTVFYESVLEAMLLERRGRETAKLLSLRFCYLNVKTISKYYALILRLL